MSTVTCVLDAKAECAECPVWVAEEQALYWTDIPGRTLNRFDPASGGNRVWPMPEEVGSFALREVGGVVAALRSGFAFIDLETGAVTHIADPETDRPDNRFNDGRCDRAGRFWAGTMHEPRTARDGALYCLEPDCSWRRVADDVLVANGLAWSPDDRRMYWSDSRNQIVYVFDYDIATGGASNRRELVRLTDAQGRPDGAAVDAEGFYWSACFMGGKVIRFAPDGRVDREVPMPVRDITMCAFGGPTLTTLYVTTSREALTAEERRQQPQAGGIFAVDAGVPGLPEPRFKG